jgi:signal peptidase I
LADQKPQEEKAGPGFKKSTARDYYETLLVTMVLLNFARIFVFQTFKIPTGSMEDNLLVGDHIVVNKFVYGNEGPPAWAKLHPFREIQRGDIIVFRFPLDPDVDYVKRVIGLPGETVEVRDKQVYVDGKPMTQEFAVFADPQTYPDDPALPEQVRIRDNMPPRVVPPGYYFAMGDNRDLSYDSRFWGFVPRAYIKGRPFMVYWSFRSDSSGQPLPVGERVKELFHVAVNFFKKTRWDRMFFIVDSKYHYTEK